MFKEKIFTKNGAHILLVFVIFVAVFLQYVFFSFMLDDPYITFRYVNNFIQGNGIVWNLGEYVEGYSNFSFLILLSPFAALGIDLYYAAKILSAFFGLATIVATYCFSNLMFGGNKFKNLIAPALLGTSIYFTLWSVGALETTLYSFLVVLTALFLARGFENNKNQLLLGLALFLVSITRPEGPIFFIISGLFFLFYIRDKKNWKLSKLNWLFLYVLTFGTYLVWRVMYYGYILPNTFYAKNGGEFFDKLFNGSRYVWEFFISYSLVTCLLLIASFFLVFKAKPYRVVWSFISLYLLIVVYSSGDWMPGFRFIVPILPLIFLMLQESIFTVISRYRFDKKIFKTFVWSGVLISFTLLFFHQFNLLSAKAPWISNNILSGDDEMRGVEKEVSDYLNEFAKPGDLVVTQEAGKIPYFTQNLNYVDIVGLNDEIIAHGIEAPLHADVGDPEYVVSRKPDWLAMWINVNEDGSYKWAMPAVKAILDHDYIKENYTLVEKIPKPPDGAPWSGGHVYWIYKKQ